MPPTGGMFNYIVCLFCLHGPKLDIVPFREQISALPVPIYGTAHTVCPHVPRV